jgi:hypothetical protein
MAWCWRRNSNPEPDPGAGSEDVGAECEAFLAGRYLEVAVRRDGPIPGWVWLNRLAHTSVTELVELSELDHDLGNSWGHVLAALAGDVLAYCRFAGVDVLSLQRDVLVPLELQVMNFNASTVLAPQQLVQLVRDTLRQQATGCS